MIDWTISKIRPCHSAHADWEARVWPPLSTFTLRNIRTGDVQEVTCRGAGLVEGMIAKSQFDPVLTRKRELHGCHMTASRE
jgi:hypothetical protein